jgi:hypothetical protein
MVRNMDAEWMKYLEYAEMNEILTMVRNVKQLSLNFLFKHLKEEFTVSEVFRTASGVKR